MKRLLLVALLLALGGCGAGRAQGPRISDAAPLRGFSIDVDRAVSARVPQVHLKTCGSWGCAELDVPLSIAGPTSTAPCPGPTGGPDGVACGPVQLPGPGPGYGYAPVPQLTLDPVTVTVTTPPGAPLPIVAAVRVRPRMACPDSTDTSTTCVGGAPQAHLRIAPDGTVSQTS